LCANYGVPASTQSQPRGRNAAQRGRDAYKVVQGTVKNITQLKCLHCDEVLPVKSNVGIHEELQRMSTHLKGESEPTCPIETCSNHSVGLSVLKAYQSFGQTKSGSKRYRCKACGKLFSVGRSTTGHKKPHKNKLIFKLLMNKSPLKRICEVADVGMPTVYAKIDFLHQQCLAFAASRERSLLNGKTIPRLYVSVDGQSYVVNWAKRSDKRNTQLSAVGSADNATGYVFGMHLNFDQSIKHDEIETDAAVNGDLSEEYAFRRYARLWLQQDYVDTIRFSRIKNAQRYGMKGSIEDEYDDAAQRPDIEASESLSNVSMLPRNGMQVHAEYTLYGHFHYLHSLFGGVGKVRFFLDQDSGIRAACLSAFQKEIAGRTCDAFYVRINKNMTVDEKRRALADSRQQFKAAQAANPSLTENEVKLLLIKQRMTHMAEMGRWNDKWMLHPFPNMSEPEKAVCYMTDYGDYDEDHRAWLYNKASMHGIDRFFMQVRRRLSLLERPIASASSAGRMWHGYSPYNPAMIAKVLDIFRVYYNYCLVGEDKQTPAMRLGLAKGKVTEEDIIYFVD